MAIGEDYIDSISKLKETARKIHQFIGNNNTTNVRRNEPVFSKAFSLKQNYPNPFNPSTTIEFTLPKPEFVKINVYNITGQLTAKLLNKQLMAGNHKIEYHCGNTGSGIYFYKIEAGAYQNVKKMIVLK